MMSPSARRIKMPSKRCFIRTTLRRCSTGAEVTYAPSSQPRPLLLLRLSNTATTFQVEEEEREVANGCCRKNGCCMREGLGVRKERVASRPSPEARLRVVEKEAPTPSLLEGVDHSSSRSSRRSKVGNFSTSLSIIQAASKGEDDGPLRFHSHSNSYRRTAEEEEEWNPCASTVCATLRPMRLLRMSAPPLTRRSPPRVAV